jgi:hypothetical protein
MERPRREEAVLEVADGALDLALRQGCQLRRIRPMRIDFSA